MQVELTMQVELRSGYFLNARQNAEPPISEASKSVP